MSYIFSEKEDAKSPLEAGSVWFCGPERVWIPPTEKSTRKSQLEVNKRISQLRGVSTNNSVKTFQLSQLAQFCGFFW